MTKIKDLSDLKNIGLLLEENKVREFALRNCTEGLILMKTNLVGILLLFACSCLSAQDKADQKWHLGLLLSLDQNQTHYVLSDWVFQGIDEIKNLDARAALGFSIGVSAEYKLSNTASLRVSPLFSFQYNSLVFIDQNNQELSIDVHPKSIGFPIHFVYAPRGRAKIPYFFVGPRLQSQIGERYNPTVFSIASTNLAVEFGIGMTVKTKLLNLSPQISFSQGLSNLKAVGESGFYNNAVRHIRSDRLSLGVIVSLRGKESMIQ